MSSNPSSSHHAPPEFDNPLCIAVLEQLRRHQEAISEHQLMRALEQEFSDLPAEADSNLLLFRKHFLLMNALYQLQQSLRHEAYHLRISALEIVLEPEQAVTGKAELIDNAAEQKVREYYLDWNNFEQADADSVAELLRSFWRRYQGLDRRQEALSCLQLDATASAAQLTKAYRKLAAQHHPDRGGDAKRFVEIREAYELLRHVLP
ncbi:DnaJ domain-containing protein [Aestuariirhabdus sp. Z084]|uniref:DNA-J related domain-containing protein n=1 Tax=Aestuariirhabdus haliotis TaxID=2918751 RepID=UPI00201B4426|nr:DNA-J related domain-containing protein [Aestuariirhabdus haliotis]MCL6414079.1 DnaJ domain-containing protein [Aestuariirhabdus haliotis]MCL6418011.1 DnaJ domain-containing protein [Aestuariirhabdus haliotis]